MGSGWGRGGGVQGDGVWEETTVSRQSFESVAKAVAVVWVVSEDPWGTLPAPSVGSPPTLPPSPPPVHPCRLLHSVRPHVFRIGNNRGVAVYFCVVFAHNLRDPVPAGLVTRVVGRGQGRSKLNCSRDRPVAPKPVFLLAVQARRQGAPRQKPSSSFPNYYINYSMLKSGGWRLIILLIQIHI